MRERMCRTDWSLKVPRTNRAFQMRHVLSARIAGTCISLVNALSKRRDPATSRAHLGRKTVNLLGGLRDTQPRVRSTSPSIPVTESEKEHARRRRACPQRSVLYSRSVVRHYGHRVAIVNDTKASSRNHSATNVADRPLGRPGLREQAPGPHIPS